MLATTCSIALLLNCAIQFVLYIWAVPLAIANVRESEFINQNTIRTLKDSLWVQMNKLADFNFLPDTCVVRTSKLVFAAMICRAIVLVLAIWTVRFTVTHPRRTGNFEKIS